MTPTAAIREATQGALRQPPAWLLAEIMYLRGYARTHAALKQAEAMSDKEASAKAQERVYAGPLGDKLAQVEDAMTDGSWREWIDAASGEGDD